jgi:hypothetical protein
MKKQKVQKPLDGSLKFVGYKGMEVIALCNEK